MHVRAAIVVSVLGLCGGCSGDAPTATAALDDVQSVCSLPALHADHDGQRVKVRGLFTLHAHGVFLRDERCPGYMLALKHTENGPDTSLCTPERLVQVFGCPGGNDNGPIVTVSGILEPSKAPKYGRVAVEEMTDFENVRTGERFNLRDGT
jgi:hypothetical protein